MVQTLAQLHLTSAYCYIIKQTYVHLYIGLVTWNTTLCWDTSTSNYHETFGTI